MTSSFRNVGPQVFISYSFKDKEMAARVDAFLASSGCRVRMEDEVSLIGHRLDQALSERIGQTEALVQLRTASASLSPWVTKELEYASTPRNGMSQPVIVPVVFEHGDLATLPDASRAIDAASGLSDQVLDVLGARIAEAVHPLPLSDADPFRFEPGALDRALRAVPVDYRRVIVDSDGRLLRWMDDCLAFIESSDVPHREKWLQQERRRQQYLVRFLDDLDGEAARLIRCLAKTYGTRECLFPGSAAKAMDYFCLTRVGLAVVERAGQVPVKHELPFRYAGIFRSLLERLPRDDDVYQAYLSWIAGGDYFGTKPSREDWAALNALSRVGIDDKTFTEFVQQARWNIPRVLRVEENDS